MVTPGTSLSFVGDAELRALGVVLGLDLGEIVAGARLQFARGLLVEALDRGDFLGLDQRQFLDRGEAFRGEQLADHLVDVERLHEHLGALLELRLAALRLLLLGQDVDVPAGELRGEADVLAAPADGERELLVGHHDVDALLVLVEHHLGDFGRRSALTTKVAMSGDHGMMSIFSPCSSFDHRLHARAAHADAGADRIDRGVARDHRDLGARAGIAGDRLDLDDAVIDLRHFLGEQLGHELRMGARQEDLRSARLAAHVVDIGADAVAVAEHLARHQLVAAHDRLAAAEIDDDIAVFDALDDAVDDVADAVLEFLILPVALGLAHLLHDHLLGRLGGDAAVFERRQRLGDVVADLGGRVAPAGVLDADLGRVVLDLLRRPGAGAASRISPVFGLISARTSVSLP